MAQTFKLAFINTLGALGYLSCVVQWLWAVVLFMPLILNSSFIKQFTQPPVAPTPVISQPADIPLIGIILMAAVTVVMILLTIYAIIKVPAVVGKTGSKIAHKATALALPVITNHKKLPPKKYLQLTARMLFISKLTLCVIPFGILLLANNPDIGLARDIVMIVASVSAACSIACFGLQAASAKLLRVDYKHVW